MPDYYMVPGTGMIGDVPVGGTIYGPVPYNNFFIDSIFAYFPKGAFWVPKRNGYFERFLYGVMQSLDAVRVVLSDLAYIRDAKLTSQLDDLEFDYGVTYNAALSIAERRANLDSVINAINNTGSSQEMQTALDVAGFDVSVYQNSSTTLPSDPANPSDIADVDSYLLVNGPVYQSQTFYLATAGMSGAKAGKTFAKAGKFIKNSALYEYPIPTDSKAWPFVFFVGGDAVFDGSGKITSLGFATVPLARRAEFEKLILKYKPAFTWALVSVNYI